MIVDVVMPKMGESINEGTILEWRKKVGESIELDEILLEIGTDKVDSEIPSSAAGIIVDILAEPNDVKAVGEVIAKIDTNSSSGTSSKDVNVKKDVEPEPLSQLSDSAPEKEKSITNSEQTTTENKEKKFYSPVVMKIASDKNVPFNELERISGTGKGGRVTKKDILAYLNSDMPLSDSPPIAESKPVTPMLSGRTEEMHHMRKLIAKHMKESLATSAHVYVMTEVDMTSIVDFVSKEEMAFKDREGFNLTYTPFIVDAVVRSLKDQPEMNSSILDTTVNFHRDINIGLAVAIDNGLMVPNMANCEEKNFLGLCRSVHDIASRTRNGTIKADELTGTTFSITNFGVFGVSMGTPIINQPNVGILGIGAIKKQPVVIEAAEGDSIAIRSMMILTLGFDHRLIDGAGGSKFLERVRYYLENMDLDDIR